MKTQNIQKKLLEKYKMESQNNTSYSVKVNKYSFFDNTMLKRRFLTNYKITNYYNIL